MRVPRCVELLAQLSLILDEGVHRRLVLRPALDELARLFRDPQQALPCLGRQLEGGVVPIELRKDRAVLQLEHGELPQPRELQVKHANRSKNWFELRHIQLHASLLHLLIPFTSILHSALEPLSVQLNRLEVHLQPLDGFLEHLVALAQAVRLLMAAGDIVCYDGRIGGLDW